MCGGSREGKCWNTIGFSGALAAERVHKAIVAAFFEAQGFEAQFRSLLQETHQQTDQQTEVRAKNLQQQLDNVQRKKCNVVDAIAEDGNSPALREKMTELNNQAKLLEQEIRELLRVKKQELVLPRSLAELQKQAEEALAALAVDDPAYAETIRKLVPEFHVYLMRLVDGGRLLPRARVVLKLGGLCGDLQHVPGMETLLTRIVTVDLFTPPQRELIREQAVNMVAQGKEQRPIARQLGVKQAVVSRAVLLEKKRRESGLDRPYVLVPEPPADYTKLRRHLHPRYVFSLREGYLRPTL